MKIELVVTEILNEDTNWLGERTLEISDGSDGRVKLVIDGNQYLVDARQLKKALEMFET